MKIILVAAAALVDPEGRVLVQERPPGKSMSGLWEFPGGKIEDGETPEAGLVRELHEELGIVADPSKLVALSFASAPLGLRHLVLLLYLCRCWRGRPIALHATRLRWVGMDELSALPMPDADRPFSRVLRTVLPVL